MELAPGIRRLGNGTVNVYLVAEPGGVTVVDAGLPGQWSELLHELAAIGRTIADVRAVVLTHGHTDHIGFAERARRERSIPIQVHELDAALARGEAPNPARGVGRVRPLPLLRFLVYAARLGGLRTPHVSVVSTFGDGATLDVPGSPRVVLVPGHTPGSAALHLPDRGALFVGDAFATYAVTSGEHAPQVAPFTADAATAVASLDRLEPLDVPLALPGHGEPWTAGIAEAVRRVRERPLPG
ncbi:MAG TPA: MBL fold metallo-hydrolase [Candidatus Limnocylindrales bacterium]|nr:MBL fold metallo-hydrolase [Candidatus Limnocylindrales bacterium]